MQDKARNVSLGKELRRITQQLGNRLGIESPNHLLKKYEEKVAAINRLETSFRLASDQQLNERALLIQGRILANDSLDTSIVEHFALVREVAWRKIGLRPYDVQVIAGLGLHEGKIVQMATGEGKTLAAVSPVALRAFSGAGVHVLTFNDYLARRDAEWMGPIYRFLGLTVGFIQEGMSQSERRKAYQSDVAYLTAKEAGFDFLRDGLAFDVGDLVQRPFQAALVDEADSILIDEARVPLVIAGTARNELGRQELVRTIIEQLQPGVDYSVDEFGRNAYLTEEGATHAETLLECGDLYAPSNLQLLTELNLALHAEALMTRDVDYIVRDSRVEIVDDFTGRVVKDRHWPYGLQTAIETKEGLLSSEDGRILGSITLQNFLRLYPHLSGMTATAETAADELFEFYNLDLLKVPPNKPCIRVDHPDNVFLNRQDKHNALLAEIADVHSTGRPILVGTTSVVESEELAVDLRAQGIKCDVLNARRDDQEARIIAQAGSLGAVTISTNMAGRGTDIRLGGRDSQERDRVAGLGGLYVIGTNRYESRRIDDQLRGRAGRQGDPGSSRFFISLEDELLVNYRISDSFSNRWRSVAPLEPVDSPIMRRQVTRAQRIVEGQNFDIRHTLWRYSTFIERQRLIIYSRRKQTLEGKFTPTVFQERSPAFREKLKQELGDKLLLDLERRLMLQAIDECWSQHLGTVTEIRDGIHLAEVGGLDPYREFLMLAADSFDQTLDTIDELAVEKMNSLGLSTEAIDLEGTGLRGPSSTWTYLVNDQVLTDRLAASLIGGRNIGFAANAALAGPLLMIWAILRRLRR